METRGGNNREMSAAAAQLLARVQAKLPPPPPIPRLTRWRMLIQTFLHDPSIDRRPFWYLLIRIGISILIGISLFVVGGKWGFAIALGLFVVGVGVSVRIRRF